MRSIIIGGCVMVSSLGTAAAVRWQDREATPVTRPQPAASATFALAAQEGFEQGEAVGRRRVIGLVVPAGLVNVRAPADGVVSAVVRRSGDRVEAGAVMVTLNDGDVTLEAGRAKAMLAAALHHADAARAEVDLLEQKGRQLRAVRDQRAAASSESAQAECQLRAAVARTKALAEERRGLETGLLELARRAEALRVQAPIGGEVVRVWCVAKEYVRAGEPLATVRSLRRHVRLHVPAILAPRLPRLQFALDVAGGKVLLEQAEVAPEVIADGTRAVVLIVPEGVDLTVGQTVSVDVTSDESPDVEAP